jgi:tripartite-type tricarboxylate transporter receptor subunit TctC
MVAPAKTPLAIRQKIHKDVSEILAMPSSREFLEKQGAEPYITATPDDMSRVLKEQIAHYGKIIKSAGIKFEP